ncbi:MAG TPA: DUF4097 family beta strand repeat-containing protein [Thermoanaerobaculia bacterium]|nr:DUF4097 family beta strand repeat-containing protein [Thermoanaerobaculia bacterium]
MHRSTPWTRRAALTALMLTAALGAALTAQAEDTAKSRAFRQAFPPQAPAIRLANLAGHVELVRGDGKDVVVEATVHAQASSAAETQKLLDGMKWVRAQDAKGRDEWALAYPVEKYKSYCYPQDHSSGTTGFVLSLFDDSHTATTYRGEKVRIYSETRSGVPTLYADLRIALPAGSHVAVRNAVGRMNGSGALEGTLSLDTGSGKVTLASYSGRLTVDTGSGNVVIGAVKGETRIDTGSGDVVVHNLIGSGSLDTGSGNVTVESLAASKLTLDTGSGNVTIKGGDAGQVIADTGSGNVKLLGVEVEELSADTGSGDVLLRSTLAQARKLIAKTGSGNVRIEASPAASFNVDSDQGSGELRVRYKDAVLRRSGRKVIGAKRGDGRTAIHIETGSGDCTIGPQGES